MAGLARPVEGGKGGGRWVREGAVLVLCGRVATCERGRSGLLLRRGALPPLALLLPRTNDEQVVGIGEEADAGDEDGLGGVGWGRGRGERKEHKNAPFCSEAWAFPRAQSPPSLARRPFSTLPPRLDWSTHTASPVGVRGRQSGRRGRRGTRLFSAVEPDPTAITACCVSGP